MFNLLFLVFILLETYSQDCFSADALNYNPAATGYSECDFGPVCSYFESHYLVDVLTSDEFDARGYPCALNYPLESISHEVDQLLADVGGSKDAPIAFFSTDGSRSEVAILVLTMQGFTNMRNIGGYQAMWDQGCRCPEHECADGYSLVTEFGHNQICGYQQIGSQGEINIGGPNWPSSGSTVSESDLQCALQCYMFPSCRFYMWFDNFGCRLQLTCAETVEGYNDTISHICALDIEIVGLHDPCDDSRICDTSKRLECLNSGMVFTCQCQSGYQEIVGASSTCTECCEAKPQCNWILHGSNVKCNQQTTYSDTNHYDGNPSECAFYFTSLSFSGFFSFRDGRCVYAENCPKHEWHNTSAPWRLIQYDCPTDGPTIHPTGLPTNIPSHRPSTFPTYLPTKPPTSDPTTLCQSFCAFMSVPLINKCAMRDCSECKECFQFTNNPTYIPTSQPTIDPSSNPTYDPSKDDVCYTVTTSGWNCPNGHSIDGTYGYSGEVNGKMAWQKSDGIYLRWASMWTQWIFDDDTVDLTSIAWRPAPLSSTNPPTGTFTDYMTGDTCANNGNYVTSLTIAETSCGECPDWCITTDSPWETKCQMLPCVRCVQCLSTSPTNSSTLTPNENPTEPTLNPTFLPSQNPTLNPTGSPSQDHIADLDSCTACTDADYSGFDSLGAGIYNARYYFDDATPYSSGDDCAKACLADCTCWGLAFGPEPSPTTLCYLYTDDPVAAEVAWEYAPFSESYKKCQPCNTTTDPDASDCNAITGNDVEASQANPDNSATSTSSTTLVIVVLIIVMCVFCCIYIVYTCHHQKKIETEVLDSKNERYESFSTPAQRPVSTSIQGSRHQSIANFMIPFGLLEGDFSPGNEIGNGADGRVFKARYGPEDVAVKFIKTNDFSVVQGEFGVLENLRHPNLVSFIGICDAPGKEYKDYEIEWSMEDRIDTMWRASWGLVKLHDINIIHRDLAARNIMVSSPGSTRKWVKIIDFGMSREIENDAGITKNTTVALRWSAPELVVVIAMEGDDKGATYSSASDIWAFACTMKEVFDLTIPYEEFTNIWSVHKALTVDQIAPKVNPSWPERIQNVVSSCWSMTPDLRPTALEVYNELKMVVEAFDTKGNKRGPIPNLPTTEGFSQIEGSSFLTINENRQITARSPTWASEVGDSVDSDSFDDMDYMKRQQTAQIDLGASNYGDLMQFQEQNADEASVDSISGSAYTDLESEQTQKIDIDASDYGDLTLFENQNELQDKTIDNQKQADHRVSIIGPISFLEYGDLTQLGKQNNQNNVATEPNSVVSYLGEYGDLMNLKIEE